MCPTNITLSFFSQLLTHIFVSAGMGREGILGRTLFPDGLKNMADLYVSRRLGKIVRCLKKLLCVSLKN